MESTKKPNNYYVDKAKFYEAIKAHNAACKQAIAAGEPTPPVTNFIADCLMKIATNFSNSIQFRNAFANFHREEMVNDAVYHCIRYINCFDAEKSQNPFAYFTQCCYRSFINRLEVEKKQLYIKMKYMSTINETDDLAEVERDDHTMDNTEIMMVGNYNEFIVDYEKKHSLGPKKRKKSSKVIVRETPSLFDEDLISTDDPPPEV